MILSTDEYQRLMQAAQGAQMQQDAALVALRRRFDERLAALAQDDAAARLRGVLGAPVALDGQIRAGEGH